MNNHLIYILIGVHTTLKLVVKIIYLYSNIGISLYYQLVTVCLLVSLYYTKKSKYIYLFVKVYKPIKLVFFKINFNKALLFNKIAIVHILWYTLGLAIWIILLLIPSKLNYFITSTHVLIIILLGVLWSAQEVLWEGFWNWNLIEISILLVNIFLLLIIHQKVIVRFKVFVVIIAIFIYWYFNHYPLKISIHNFTNNKYLKVTNWLAVPIIILLYYNSTKVLYWVIVIMWYLQIIKLLSTQTLVYKSFLLTYLLITYVNTAYLFFLWNINLILLKIIFFVTPFLYRTKFIKQKIIILMHVKIVLIFVLIILFQYIFSFSKYFIYNNYKVDQNIRTQISFSQNTVISHKKILGFNSNFNLIVRYRTLLMYNIQKPVFLIV